MQLETQIARVASRGLHDAAQPLTVLQGLLELSLEQAHTVEDYRESVTAALLETARVTACFKKVRQLMRLQQPAPDVCDFSISQAVQDVVHGLEGVNVVFSSTRENLVYASHGRVRQALSLLISAVALNGPDDVAILIEPQMLAVEVRLSISGDTDLLASNLELPQLIATSTGGEIRFNETLDCVSLILPKAVVEQPTDTKGTFTHV